MGIELFIAIFLGVIALALVAILIVFLIWFIKRKTPATQPYSNPRDNSPEQSSKTEFVGEYTVKLSAQDSGESWTKTVKGDIYLGRDEDCDIRLTDGSVSRKQCRISSAGQGLIITNLSETNKTILNGTQITGSNPLQSADTGAHENTRRLYPVGWRTRRERIGNSTRACGGAERRLGFRPNNGQGLVVILARF